MSHKPIEVKSLVEVVADEQPAILFKPCECILPDVPLGEKFIEFAICGGVIQDVDGKKIMSLHVPLEEFKALIRTMKDCADYAEISGPKELVN